MCYIRYRSARSGFTLAELLMAIAIIVILIALSAAAVLRFGNVGGYQASVATIAKLKTGMDKQWQAVVQKAKSDPINVSATSLSVTSLADGQARQKFIEARLAQAFPTSFNEVFNPPNASMGAWGPYKTYLNGLGLTASSGTAEEQQAVLLQMILERGPANPGMTPDVLGRSASVRLTLSGTSISADACVDGWGRPLLFSRNYKGASSMLGIVSMGADAKAGVAPGTLSVTSPTDATDNISLPE